MDQFITMAFAILFQLLQDKKAMGRWVPALVKVYLQLDALVNTVPTFAAEVEKKRLGR